MRLANLELREGKEALFEEIQRGLNREPRASFAFFNYFLKQRYECWVEKIGAKLKPSIL